MTLRWRLHIRLAKVSKRHIDKTSVPGHLLQIHEIPVQHLSFRPHSISLRHASLQSEKLLLTRNTPDKLMFNLKSLHAVC